MRRSELRTTHPAFGVLMSRKYFTLADANRALPLVRRIMADIGAEHPRWHELVQRHELAAAQARPDWGESPEQLALRAEIESVAREISGFIAELDQVGCVFKGFEPGLVDFHGKLDGRDVFWCWREGEETIAHYHEIEAGYAGRRPVPAGMSPARDRRP